MITSLTYFKMEKSEYNKIEIKREEEVDIKNLNQVIDIKSEEVKEENETSTLVYNHEDDADDMKPCSSGLLKATEGSDLRENKDDFKIDELKYETLAEVQFYHCDECKFDTKYKQSLVEHHVTLHQKEHVASAGYIFKCDQCEYQTKSEPRILQHQLDHKLPPSKPMHRCDQCQYKTVLKRYLAMHQLKHKNAGVQMYKCEKCKYQTVYKQYLVSHRLRHNDPAYVQMYEMME